AITILYSSDDGQTSRLHRLSVFENGGVAEQEAMVYESANEILAVSADMRMGLPASFIAVEADRAHHNQLGFIRVPLSGGASGTGLREFPGWPMIAAPRTAPRPARSTGVALDVDAMGMPWLAMVAEDGAFAGGRL